MASSDFRRGPIGDCEESRPAGNRVRNGGEGWGVRDGGYKRKGKE